MKIVFRLLIISMIIVFTLGKKNTKKSNYKYDGKRTNAPKPTKTMCMEMANTLRARRKTCFLRPDTGPCRADIIQWYYDVKQKRCFRFFWGGCQGNGNKFETRKQCRDYCYLNMTNPPLHIPYFCSMSFDYGSCFGHYYRWTWDTFSKTCKRRLYSGCGGNQNNFESHKECLKTCLNPPSNALAKFNTQQLTTCIPFDPNNVT